MLPEALLGREALVLVSSIRFLANQEIKYQSFWNFYKPLAI